MGCPPITTAFYRGEENWTVSNIKGVDGVGLRLDVPVRTLRLATNSLRFSLGPKQAEFEADFVFTGSYYNTSRKIMAFDPANMSPWRGVIYGQGWNAAQVSSGWKNIFRGVLPFNRMPSVRIRIRQPFFPNINFFL